LGKVTDKIPLEQLFAFATSATMMLMIWGAFKGHVQEVGSSIPGAFGKYTDYRQRQIWKKISKG
jgi:hypothetical protein